MIVSAVNFRAYFEEQNALKNNKAATGKIKYTREGPLGDKLPPFLIKTALL